MSKLIPNAIFLLLALCFVAPRAMGQSTYYISSSIGSDSNTSAQAKSKTTPWKNAPAMPGASGNANSYKPVAGDKFIFMGCDTWTFNGSWNWTFSGTSGNNVSVGGLDQTWYNTSVCPNAWNRPILSGGGTWPGSTAAFMVNIDASYLEIAWFEWTGFHYNSVNTSNEIGIISFGSGDYRQLHDNYFHGWSHAAGATENEDVNVIYSGAAHDRISYNAFDGADTDQRSTGAIYAGAEGEEIDHNYFAYQNDTMNFLATLVHDNTFNNAGVVEYIGANDHNNAMESNQDPASGMLVYNNYYFQIMGGPNCGNPAGDMNTCGGVGIQIAPPAGATSYFFNNVVADASPAGNNVMCEQSITNPGGTCYIFNNTEECGADSSLQNGECVRLGGLSGKLPVETLVNNHFITDITPAPSGTNLVTQTKATANGQGYTLGQTFSFSPTSPNGATVLAGANMTATCQAIAKLNQAAGTACLSDTTYGINYNTVTHQITGSQRTAVARPTSGPWDIGAYQFNGVNASKPNPPTGLTVIVH
ncbi:MAG TPA: hypothetical protein VK709_19260 [Candidatus Saccharimonadales bacterium]|jgi:hypothetical protein|nr:hypothetical protein [Candidatus Saccharimonadales bacterium]